MSGGVPAAAVCFAHVRRAAVPSTRATVQWAAWRPADLVSLQADPRRSWSIGVLSLLRQGGCAIDDTRRAWCVAGATAAV